MQKPKLSILMSTYGETENNIREAVESMLSQTLPEFELIVINDNPKRSDVESILYSYHDNRIRFYQNTTNIGLAMSMNKAAEMARTNVYARMDADDIAIPTRLENQYDIIRQGSYDLVFSDYCYINEKSELIKDRAKYVYYTSEQLNRVLAIDNVIHHPTVMFTREIFEKVGGYRNFPCSQDADLWFRMHEVGCKFFMIPEKLLLYRINTNSISSKRWYQQQLTCNYIFDLSIERLVNGGKDSFSIENYSTYLLKWGMGNLHKEEQLKKDYNTLSKANICKTQGKIVQSFMLRLWVFITSSYMRNHILKVIKKKKYIKTIAYKTI